MELNNYWNRRRLTRRRFVAGGTAGLAGAAAFGLVGCGDDDDDGGSDSRTTAAGTGTATQAAGSPTPAPTLTQSTKAPTGNLRVAVATLQEMSSNPFFQTGGLSTPIVVSAFESFMRIGADGQSSPALATALEIPDTSTFVFKVRQGVKFQDGSDFTAEDAVWSFQTYTSQTPMPGPATTLKNAVASVTATDAQTVTVKLAKPSPFQMNELGNFYYPQSWPIASRAYYEKVGLDAFKNTPIATGPFKVTKNAVGQAIEFEAFEGYWDKARVPRVKTLKLSIVPEQQTRIAQLKTGEAEIIEGIAGPAGEALANESGIKIVRTEGTGSLSFRVTELGVAPWSDKRLREALVISIDQESIAKGLLKMGKPGPNVTMFPTTKGFDEKMFPVRKFDLTRAKLLVQEAGAAGLSFDLHSYESSSYPLIPQVVQAIAQMWKEIGLNPNIKQQESGAYFTAFQARQLKGVAPIAIPFGSLTQSTLAAVSFHKTGRPYCSNDNYPGMDDLIARMESETDPAKQIVAAQAVHKLVYDDFLLAKTPNTDSLWATSSKVKAWVRLGGVPYVSGLETVELS